MSLGNISLKELPSSSFRPHLQANSCRLGAWSLSLGQPLFGSTIISQNPLSNIPSSTQICCYLATLGLAALLGSSP